MLGQNRIDKNSKFLSRRRYLGGGALMLGQNVWVFISANTYVSGHKSSHYHISKNNEST